MNSTKEQFTELLLKELKSYVGIQDQIITLKSLLEEDLGVDSLGIIDLFLYLEDRNKDIQIGNHFLDINKMKTVEALRDFIWGDLVFQNNLDSNPPEKRK